MLGRNARDTDEERREMLKRPVQEERRERAWIGASVVIDGNLTSSEDMTIAGEIDGDVRVPTNTLVIAPQARIHGDIVAHHVSVLGKVWGSITADGSVDVGHSGSVDGDIRSPRMTVAEGAALRGRLRIADPTS